MTPGTAQLSRFIQQHGWDRILFATDLDGTPLDYADDPENVIIPDTFRSIAEDASAATQGHFVVITGRDADFVDKKVFPGKSYPLSAEHHAQVRYQGETELRDLITAPDWGPVDADITQEVHRLRDTFQGVFAETGKRFARVLHWRPVAAEKHDAVAQALQPLALRCAALMTNTTGHVYSVKKSAMAFEIGPKAADKGIALTDFLNVARRHKGEGVVAIYAGDSGPDLPAGKVAQESGGLFISVGPNEELRARADISFDTPTDYIAAVKHTLRPGL